VTDVGPIIESELDRLVPRTNALPDWDDVKRRGAARSRVRRNDRRARRLWWVGVPVVGLLIALSIAIPITIRETRASATGDSPLALLPGNVAALNAPNTVVPNPPPYARIGETPAPGTVHALGDGAALAWVISDRICWSTRHAGGCIVSSPSAVQAIDPVISDPDGIRSGQPAEVFGIAVDAVNQVTAFLVNGSQFSATPIDNWYEIDLPPSAAPWDVARIEARSASGQVIPCDLPTRPPPSQ
jgi:hypothetical protein